MNSNSDPRRGCLADVIKGVRFQTMDFTSVDRGQFLAEYEDGATLGK